MIKGFKGTDSNMTCKGFKYELGVEHSMNMDNINMCAIGFHFSLRLEDVFNFYYDRDSRFFEIEADECAPYNESDDKVVCSRIRLVKEIFPYDVTHPSHKELMLHMCKITPYNLKWIPEATKTPDFLMEVVKHVPTAIEYITNPSAELMMEAAKNCGPAILLMPTSVSEDIKMAAIQSHWYSIRHMVKPSEALQFEAVYRDIDAIYFIDSPTQAVKDYVQGVIDGTITPIPPGGLNYDGLYLNEICGGKQQDGTDDWVEIINISNNVKDISGMILDKNGSSTYVIPKGTSMQPKSVFTISSINDGMFSISNTKQVVVSLLTPAAKELDKFDKQQWFPGAETLENGHPIGGSYARIPDGTGDWVKQTTNSIGEINSGIEDVPGELIRLNEICGGNEHSDDDWIELYNKSNVAVDISNYMLIKDEASIFKVPAGTIISPKGYVTFNNIRDAMFKVSNSKSVAVALETAEGVRLDIFDKDKNLPVGSSHLIGGSYARETDGDGVWCIRSTHSLGSTNGSTEPEIPEGLDGLVINEVCVANGGVGTDWVEIYNTSNETKTLKDCKVFIGSTAVKTFTTETIAPNTRLVVDTILTSTVYKNIIVKLVSPKNNVLDEFNKDVKFTPFVYHNSTGSYARFPDGTGEWMVTYTSSKNAANINNPTNPSPSPEDSVYAGLIINEICGGDNPEMVDGVETRYDWVELYNTNSTPVNIKGLMLCKDGLPIYCGTNVTIQPSSYLVLGQKEGHFTDGISSDKQVEISIHTAKGTLLNKFNKTTDINALASHPVGGSYARIPNITGNWSVVDSATKGTANVGNTTEIDYSNLVLNEVCGGDFEPILWDDGLTTDNDDWVELYNKGTQPIDISGVTVIKDGTAITYTIPENTTLNANSYFVASRAKGQLTSGISNGTKLVSIAIAKPSGDVIDSLTCATDLPSIGHSLGASYARVPNGTGNWKIMNIGQSTRGDSNDNLPANPYEGLVLNEICGYGSEAALDKDDWVEIYNNTDRVIDTSDLKILYSNNTEQVVDSPIHTFAKGTSIQPKGRVVITPADGNISNTKVITVKLVSADNVVISVFDRAIDSKESGHNPGGSYARIPDGTGIWYAVPTHSKNLANPTEYVPEVVEPTGIDYSAIVLNEVCGSGTDGAEDDWVEIFNNSDTEVDISGLLLKKDNTQIYKVPKGVIIAPRTYLVWGIKNGDFTNGISNSKAVKISLHSPDGPQLANQVFEKLAASDETYGTGHIAGGSYARIPNATGNFTVVDTHTQGLINN
ncbi:MAG: lamin tail domain-containing protein [Bacteroidales bacterium]